MHFSNPAPLKRLTACLIAVLTWQVFPLVAQSTQAGNKTIAAKRPNIVVFISDDHGYEDSGCYGNQGVRTPNLDKLAAEGMRFTNSFANTPTCVPSRAVFFSGLMPARNGAHPNHSKMHPDVKTLPTYLKALGYRVVLAGKKHLEPLSSYPFEFVEAYDNPKNQSFVAVLHDLNVKVLDSLITALSRQPAEQPFCLVVASYAPHVGWPEVKGYDPAKIDLPPYLVNTELTRKVRAQYYTEITNDLEQTLGTCLSSLKKNKLEENTLFIYTADEGPQFPFAKWNLYDAGIRTPYIARWPGKIEPGSTQSAMISHVDMLPALLEVAGGKAKAPEGIDGVSYLPVLLGQKQTHREAVFATHTADVKYGKFNYYPMRSLRTPKYKYILNLEPQLTYTTHITNAKPEDGKDYWDSWVTQAKTDPKAAELVQKYQHRSAEELYDLSTDPYDLHNIAADPANAQQLKSFREQLLKWMDSQNDQEGLTLYYTNIKYQ